MSETSERRFDRMTMGEIMRTVLREAAERGDEVAARVLAWNPGPDA